MEPKRWMKLVVFALAGLGVCAAPFSHAVLSFTSLITGVSAPTAFVDPPDGLPHRFVAQQVGNIRVWDGSTLLATPFLDLRNDVSVPVAQRKVSSGGERGLLSMTVHPNYKTNGFFYLYYTSRDWDGAGGINTGDIVIERYTRSAGNPEIADPATSQIILVVPHPDTNHNGGDIEFGQDGYLYITLGDGGGGCDSTAHSGQDPNQLLGKMLRLDVDGADAFPGDPLKNYAIPAGNPFVGMAGEDEIWVMGLRNPFRFSFDRVTGDAYIGDVGQDDWEEINHLPVGAVTAGNPINFGWPCREGLDPSGCANPPQGCGGTFTDPVRQEANVGAGGNWTSIMGGYLYGGSQTFADLGGRYLYGDAGNDQVWLANPAGGVPWPSALATSGLGPYGFGEDQLGELYVLSAASGAISCVHGGGGCSSWAIIEDIFHDGFESSDTSAWTLTQP